jgi:hypothetical protein
MRIAASLTGRPIGDRRRSTRARLVENNTASGIDFVVVTDLSSEGAQLVAPAPLEIGSEVALTLPMLEPLDGQIIWVSKRLAGCRFLDPLHPAVLRVLVAAAQG